MSITYDWTTNFAAKDSLPANDPDKVIVGGDFHDEFIAIQAAFTKAAPTASPSFSGTANFNGLFATGNAVFATNATVAQTLGTNDLLVTGTTSLSGAFSSRGIEDNATSTALTLSASGAATFESSVLAERCNVRNVGTTVLELTDTSNALGSKFLRSSAGRFDIVNHDYSAAILYIDDDGDTNITGSFTCADDIKLNNDSLVKFEKSPTGTAGVAWELTGTNFGSIKMNGNEDMLFNIRATGSSSFVWGRDSDEFMRIDPTGRVLINQTTPDENLNLEVMAPTGFSIGAGFHTTSTQSTISFKDSTTTAHYAVRVGSEGDDLLMFAGVGERMRIDSAGNIVTKGTGNSNPQLAVTNTSTTTSYLRFSDTASTTSQGRFIGSAGDDMVFGQWGVAEHMRIDSSGNVGIGTTQPGLYNANANDLVAGLAGTGGNRGITIASGSSALGTIAFANGPTGNDLVRQFIRADHSDGAMLFATGAGEKMRIDATGNVGIGTDSPSYDLQVGDYGVSTVPSIAIGSSTTGVGSIRFGDGSAGPAANAGKISYDHADNYMSFDTNVSEAMRIDSAGRVLINKTTSEENLNLEVKALAGNSIVSGFYTGSTQSTITFRDSNTSAMHMVRIGSEGDDLLMFAGGSEAMRIDDAGNLLVGTTTRGSLGVQPGFSASDDGRISSVVASASVAGYFGRSTNGEVVRFNVNGVDSGGIVGTSGASPAFRSPSDERLKDNITDHESELANVMSLRPTRWDWKDESRGSGEGFIAQELEATAWSDLVSEGDDGFKQVSGLGAVETRLIKAMQEQQAMIEALKAEVEALKNA